MPEEGIAERAGTALEAILAFLAREQVALNQSFADSCGQAVEDRIRSGNAVGPLRLERKDPEGSLMLRCEEDSSRFREGDSGYLGPTRTGEAEIMSGLPVRYAGFDERQKILRLYTENEVAPGPTSETYYLDQKKVDLTDTYVSAARSALGSGNPNELISAMLLGGKSTIDARKGSALKDIARKLGFNPSQQEAYAAQAKYPLALVQGPPGTGKTRVLGAVVGAQLAEGKRVLLCTLAHRAANNALNASVPYIHDNFPLLKLGNPEQGTGLHERAEQLTSASDVANRLRGQSRAALVATSVARVPGLLQRGMDFDLVLFDEAGQLTLPQALCGAIAAPRALFFGDHRQLPPIFQSDHHESEWAIDRSVFEILLDRHTAVLLRITYRLNNELVLFPSCAYYDGKLRASPGSAGRRLIVDLDAADPLFPILDPAAPLVWAEVPQPYHRPPSSSEVEVVAACVQQAFRGGLKPDQMAVISPYRAQNQAIRNRLRQLAVDGVDGADSVVVDTVERMQGQERDLIVLSLTASDPVDIERQAEFLYLPNRLNVAITRARTKCIVVGSPVLLRQRSTNSAVLRGVTALLRLTQYARIVSIEFETSKRFQVRLVREAMTRSSERPA